MKKRLFATVLALCLLLGLLPGGAWAAEKPEISGTCGKNATWSFDPDTETLTISGTGAMEDYDCEGNHNPPPYGLWNGYAEDMWDTPYEDRTFIRSVVVSEGITHIGSDAFGSFTMLGVLSKLQNVQLPSTLKSIGKCAFTNAESLTSIELPSGLVSIDAYAFSGTALTALHLPASLREIGDDGLGTGWSVNRITVDPQNRNFTTVNDVLYKVNASSSWEILLYPGGCTRTDYTIPSQVSELPSSILSGKAYLQTITVPSTVKKIPETAFMNCPNLSSVSLPEGLVSIDPSAFWRCTSLSKLEIPSSVTSFKTTITPGDSWNGDTSQLTVYFKSRVAPEFDASISELKYADNKNGKVIIYYPAYSSGWEDIQNQPDIKTAVNDGVMEFRTWVPEPAGLAQWTKLFPVNGASDIGFTGSDLPIFQITFDREIASNGSDDWLADIDLSFTGAFSIYRASDGKLIYKPSQYASHDYGIAYSDERSTLSIKPFYAEGNTLEPSTTYYVTMGEGFVRFKDGSTNSEIKKGEWKFTTAAAEEIPVAITYASAIGTDSTYSGLSYHDKWFYNDSSQYNHDLAKMSLGLAMTGFGSKKQTDYPDINVRNLFANLKFNIDTYKSYGYEAEDKGGSENTVAMALCQKDIYEEDGNKSILLAICLRGAEYGDGGWAGNVTIGTKSEAGIYHKGFHNAAVAARKKIEDYVKGLDTDNVRVWLTGFSRSAAIANLLSAELRTSGLFNGKNIYTYTFATPNNQEFSFNSYDNIFNIINPNDIVPTVPPHQWAFGKMGQSYLLPSMIDGYQSTEYANSVRSQFSSIVHHATQYATRGNVKPTLTWLNYTIGNAVPHRYLYTEHLEKHLTEFFLNDRDIVAFEPFLCGVITIEELKEIINNSIAGNIENLGKLAITIGDIQDATPASSPLHPLLSIIKDVLFGAVSEQLANGKKGYTNNGIIASWLDIASNKMDSYLLMEHWPEVYLAWMTSIEATDLTPTNQFKTKAGIVRCPIDINIYNEANAIVARIVNDTVQEIKDSNVSVAILGESEKVFVLPNDQNYRVELIATDSGTMNYSIIETAAVGTALRTVEFVDVQLKTGDTFTGCIDDTLYTTVENYALTKNNGETVISANYDSYTDTPTPDIPDVSDTPNTNYISVPKTANGEIIPSTRYAAPSERVTLSIHPDDGFELASLTVTDVRGRTLTLRDLGDNRRAFTMPDNRVTVDAVFQAVDAPSTNPADDEPFTGLGTPGITGIVLNPAPMPFTDVQPKDWFYDNVDYMWKHYLMSGVTDTQFSPNVTTSRAMIWTILARMNKIKANGSGNLWYEPGMLWAMEQGVTDGTSPLGDITREQLATMLWRNAGKPTPGAAADLSRFSDSSSVSDYAQTAVRWAASVGILQGNDGRIDPLGTATRAQVAAMVARYGDRIA